MGVGKKIATHIGVLALLAGCAHVETEERVVDREYEVPPELLDAAEQASAARATLAAVVSRNVEEHLQQELAQSRGQNTVDDGESGSTGGVSQAHERPDEFDRVIRMDYAGEAEEAVEAFADLIGYKFTVRNRPAGGSDKMIRLNGRQSIGDHLNELSSQSPGVIIADVPDGRLILDYRYSQSMDDGIALAREAHEERGENTRSVEREDEAADADVPPFVVQVMASRDRSKPVEVRDFVREEMGLPKRQTRVIQNEHGFWVLQIFRDGLDSHSEAERMRAELEQATGFSGLAKRG